MTTYTFLKALELLISKMGRSRAEKISPWRNSTKLPFYDEKYIDVRNELMIEVVTF